MYETFFQLNARPFTAAPFVHHYYPASSIQAMFSQSQQAIDRGAGPVVVVGGAGTGKTLLLMKIAEQYEEQFRVINLVCARLAERSDLLQSVLFELKQPYKGMSEGELRLALMDYLRPDDDCPNGILLLVDEAHQLGQGLLEEVCLLTNLVRNGEPRVRLVIAGKHRLEDELTNPKLDSFNQRIATRGYLTNLSCEETGSYIHAHIDRVNGRGPEIFPEATTRVIFEVTDGCPRLVNQLCEQALMLSAVSEQSIVTEQCASEAWRDVQNISAAVQQVKGAEEDSGGEKWTVLEFGQLDDEESGGSEQVMAYEIATEDEQHNFAANEEYQDDIARPLSSFQLDSNESHEELANGGFPVDDSFETEQDDVLDSEPDSEFDQNVEPSFETDQSQQFAAEADAAEADSAESDAAEADAADFDAADFDAAESDAAESDSAEAGSLETESFEDEEFQFQEPRFIPGLENPMSAENPFVEDYEEEEFLLDKYIPVVAAQNRSSLSLTSNDLEVLRPESRISFEDFRSDLLNDTPDQSTVDEVDSQADSQVDWHADSLENRDTAESDSYQISSSESTDDGHAVPVAEESESEVELDAVESRFPVIRESADTLSEEEYNKLLSEELTQEELLHGHDAVIEALENLGESDSLEDGREVTPDSDSFVLETDHPDQVAIDEAKGDTIYAPEFDNGYVERRAEKILVELDESIRQQVKTDENVTHIFNLSEGEEEVQSEGEAKQNSPPKRQAVITEHVDDNMTVVSIESIQEQTEASVQEVADFVQGMRAENEAAEAGSQEDLASLPIEYPVLSNEGQEAGMPEDDRDMIIVSRADQLPSPERQGDVETELLNSEPSKGRAERMEYQQLFDQLRNQLKD